MKYLLLLFTAMNFAQGHKFIPLDEENLEAFSKLNYKEADFKKENLPDVVLLTKIAYD